MYKGVGLNMPTAMGVFIAIGLSCWLAGCDETLQPYCFRFDIERSLIGGYYVPLRTCSYCSQSHQECDDDGSGKNCYEVCDRTTYYDCWDGYAEANYPLLMSPTGQEEISSNNKTCMLQVVNDNADYSYTLRKTQNRWPLGKEVTMYISKIDNRCYTGGTVQTIALVGVIFLGMAGVLIILTCCHHGRRYAEKVRLPSLPNIVSDHAGTEMAARRNRNTENNRSTGAGPACSSAAAPVEYTAIAVAAPTPTMATVIGVDTAVPMAYDIVPLGEKEKLPPLTV